MSKWSSNKRDQLIFEGWRRFLNEQDEQPAPAPDTEAGGMEALLGKSYTSFVQWLGGNIKDPKTQALISSGLEDGDKGDDTFGFQSTPIAVAALKPTQSEIDVDKSLAFPLVKDPAQFIEKVVSNGPFTVVEPIITYNGKWIIDGHHRWSTVYACNKNASINAINITIEGVDPMDVLKAVQMAIGQQAGKIPVQSVEGTNLLEMGQKDISRWIDNKVPQQFYAVIEKNPKVLNLLKSAVLGGSNEKEKPQKVTEAMAAAILQRGLTNYIWSNVASMRKTSQPHEDAGPRDFMPQTGGVDWKEPLAQGKVDIKPPFAKVAESKIYKRWKILTG